MTDVALMVYSLGGGGVERMRIHLAEALDSRGYRTDLVAARADGPYRAQVPPGVRLIDLGASSWKAWLDALASYLRREEPRVLLAAMETAGVIALWARRRTGVASRIVVSCHVEISRHMQQEPKRLKRAVMPYLVRRLYQHADGVVAVSNGVARNLARFARLPRASVRVIYNPVVTDKFLDAGAKDAHRAPLVDNERLILGAGRLTGQKDFRTLLRAFARVRKCGPAQLVILGEGEERSSLEALVRELGIAEHVRMPGFVADPSTYMRSASLFACSSAWEGFGNVLVEALACGCPVVSTDCPSGPREILEDGRYGCLVAVGDHEALAHAIHQTLDNPPDPRLLRARALDFHVDKVVEQYIDVMGLA